ncbi:MAG TPA: hypothetical protein DDW67_09325 [Elusimicrobia bacterium]|nr:hypothetical protein [Elusimicrobiota bacterium]
MLKSAKKIEGLALSLMLAAVFVMAAHIYEHAFSRLPGDDILDCQVCDLMAGVSAHGAVAPDPPITVFRPALPAVTEINLFRPWSPISARSPPPR